MSDKFEVLAFNLSNHLERIQVHINCLLHSANHKFAIIYGNSVLWLDGLDLHGKLGSTWTIVNSKYEECMNIISSNVPNVSQYISSVKAFVRNDVSKQAVYFGFAGLVTGGVIGLCIGYTFTRPGIFSSQYFPSPANNGFVSTFMKGIFCSCSRKGIDGITLVTIPVPRQLGPDQVLIQIKAVGLDNIDARIAGGYRSSLRVHLGLPPTSEPFLLGRECSGIVLEVGSQVKCLAVNDRVWACVPLWASVGLMSEYVVLSERYVGQKPRNISFEGGATLPYASLIVWREIITKYRLGPLKSKNKRILVHLGATSKNDGVGLLATQVLKAWGARVTISTHENFAEPENSNTSSSGVAQMTFLHTLKSLGAESHIIIPNDEALLPDLTQRIFDVVVNTDSNKFTPVLQNFVKEFDGKVVETFPPELERNYAWGILNRIGKYLFRNEPGCDDVQETLEACKKMVESGLVVPVVARSFLASQYDQAFHHVSSSSHSALAHAHVGKCVIVFKPLSSPL